MCVFVCECHIALRRSIDNARPVIAAMQKCIGRSAGRTPEPIAAPIAALARRA